MSFNALSYFDDFFLTPQPLYLNVILAVYMFSYVLLVCAVILLLSFVVDSFLLSLGFKAVLSLVVRYRLRWFLLLVFANMAALPPSFFFFSKLGMLASVLSVGTWASAVLFLSYVLFSWSIYYAMMRYGVTSLKITSATTLEKQRLTPRGALVVTSMLAVFTLMPFLFEDFFFVMYWFLV